MIFFECLEKSWPSDKYSINLISGKKKKENHNSTHGSEGGYCTYNSLFNPFLRLQTLC